MPRHAIGTIKVHPIRWRPRGQARAPGSREPSRPWRLGLSGFDPWRIAPDESIDDRLTSMRQQPFAVVVCPSSFHLGPAF
jgi:hypothetical protein